MAKLKENKRGVITLYITFIIVAIIIITLAAVFAPMGVLFNTEMVTAGEDILLRANDTIAEIGNTSIRAAIYDTTNSALAAAETNISVNNNLFEYSWLLIIGISALIIFIFSRQIVEYGGGLV